jgi:tRNA A37 threonylcarbamoyladenosine synthetase subunit TsaC/SUA5/YrdC
MMPTRSARASAKQLELVIDGGACSMEPTTVIDLTGDDAELVRQGRGDAAAFGL